MKLRSRFEHFLAKIAGRDVDIGTLTPPVPVNATEELMLEIAGKQLPVVFATYNGEKSTLDYDYYDVYGKANGDELFLVVGYINPENDEFVADTVYTQSSIGVFVSFSTQLENALTVITAAADYAADYDEEGDEIVGYKSWAKVIVSAE